MSKREPSADPSQLLAAHNAIVPIYNKYCTDKDIGSRYDGKLKAWPTSRQEDSDARNEASEHFGEVMRYALTHDCSCLVIDLLVTHHPLAYRDLLTGYYVNIGLSPSTLGDIEKLRNMVTHSHNWRFLASILRKIDQLGQLRPIVGNAVHWLE